MATANLLNAVAAVGPGATFGSLSNSTFYDKPRIAQFVITGTATAKLEGSMDGTNWETIVSASASSAYADLPSFSSYRGNVTSWTSGTITLMLGN